MFRWAALVGGIEIFGVDGVYLFRGLTRIINPRPVCAGLQILRGWLGEKATPLVKSGLYFSIFREKFKKGRWDRCWNCCIMPQKKSLEVVDEKLTMGNKSYVIHRTASGVLNQFTLSLVIVAVLTIACWKADFGVFGWLKIPLYAYAFRIGIYVLIDFLFEKKFLEIDDDIYIKTFFSKFKLDKNRSYLIIAPAPLLRYTSEIYYLNLVRNDKRLLNRVFKNRIKLYVEDGELDLKGIARKISDMFGIPFRDVELGINSYWNDGGELQKNKGIIP